jgi:hypothetical protein
LAFHYASWTRVSTVNCNFSAEASSGACAIAEGLKGKTKEKQQHSCFHKLSSKNKTT